MIYNILDDEGLVINTILASADFVQQAYSGHYALVGAEAVVESAPIITKTAMLTRFTDAEFAGILAASKTDAQVEAWRYRFDNASGIDLSDSRTIAGADLLAAKNLLTQARLDAILNDPVRPDERV